ncbi:hypothetical protein [Bacillus sp. JJ722]|uniref:hypothetical protein n=1 Tax=Bacillus sp. JJ722 TaxID=3122973 RepID=UPI003000E901
MFKVIISICLSFILVGCSNPSDSKVEKKEVKSEVSSRHKEFIEMILSQKYEEVLKETTMMSEKGDSDYFNMASLLNDKKNFNTSNYIDSSSVSSKVNYEHVRSSINGMQNMYSNIENIPAELDDEMNDLHTWLEGKAKEYDKLVLEDLLADYSYRAGVKESEPVKIGMTQEEVIKDGWGSPEDINKTITADVVSEQWVYPNYNNLYFEDGILTSIQN